MGKEEKGKKEKERISVYELIPGNIRKETGRRKERKDMANIKEQKMPFKGNCYNCARKGHEKSACPELGKGIQGECHKCGVKGHPARLCRTISECRDQTQNDERNETSNEFE